MGVHKGNFFINKPLFLRGKSGSVLDGGGKDTVLKISSEDVRVENLTIINSGDSLGNENAGIHAEDSPGVVIKDIHLHNVLYGIRILASPNATIEDCEIKGMELELGRRGDGIKIWYSPDATIRNNRIEGVRDILIWYSDRSKTIGNKMSGNRYGLHYMYSHNNLAAENEIKNSSVGIYGMYSNDIIISNNKLFHNRGPSGYGFAAKESERLKILDNYIVGNREGLHFDNSPLQAPKNEGEKTLIQGNYISFNDIGVGFIGMGNWNYFYKNDFKENWQQVRALGSPKILAELEGNYWSDYQGFDVNQDGIGDIHYKSVDFVDTLVDRTVAFQAFRFSPVMFALQYSEKLFPWFVPAPKFEDPKPNIATFKSMYVRQKVSITLLVSSALLILLSWLVQKAARI